MKYPIGTRLRLINANCMAATNGAIAALTQEFDTNRDDLACVTWLQGGNGQMDGRYGFSLFALHDDRKYLDQQIAALQAQRAVLDEIHAGDSVITPKGNHGTVNFVKDTLAWVTTKKGQNIIFNIEDLRKTDD